MIFNKTVFPSLYFVPDPNKALTSTPSNTFGMNWNNRQPNVESLLRSEDDLIISGAKISVTFASQLRGVRMFVGQNKFFTIF